MCAWLWVGDKGHEHEKMDVVVMSRVCSDTDMGHSTVMCVLRHGTQDIMALSRMCLDTGHGTWGIAAPS